jgi:hypothetical protein
VAAIERVIAVGYRFTLVLNREVTDDESAALREAGCGTATFGRDSLPTNADVQVTKLDFDDTASPSLAEAIESALEAVKKVPDITVPGLTVPAQPATAEDAEKQAAASAEKPDVVAGEVIETGDADAGNPAGEKPAAKTAVKKTTAKKPAARKATAKKPATRKASSNGNGKADSAAEPDDAVAAYAGSADSSR